MSINNQSNLKTINMPAVKTGFVTTSRARVIPLVAGSLACSLLLSACNTPTKAIESAKQTQKASPAETAKAEVANIKRKAGSVSTKGTNIRAIVNEEIVTNTDVSKRLAFSKLRRIKGANRQKALDELVEQSLKMQEASLRKTRANDSEVDAAFANFAKGNKLKVSQLSSVLNRNGITSTHFKEFIRTQISWNRTVSGKFRSDVTINNNKNILAAIRKSGKAKPSTNEYILQQVIFVVPKAKRKAMMASRKKQAESFRFKFQSCATTKQLAVGEGDVTVRALPRILEPQLPREWKDDVIKTPVGYTTNTLETDKGVEFLAICSKRSTSDDNVAQILTQSEKFEDFNKRGEELSKEYLDELKAKAQIV
ncbi:MAG: SurA N-terminal domain-containing protein, partial [Nitratireductor sp.]